ncbi:hypothetical protein [Pseudooctadecabacter jejudonensis]|uniref:Uncharacterized protein n=1 Tax=Pseudooctadecabacter jejudonensis TaxID=1391910 RepID=A0A1Y5R7N6_9RHOB|nr:hypothetical protein [Pseudooctadecabacter jejudonensis]SLN11015.1 hypothetical protein PSJ8397_00070 [Pseudooctadecabacter jejudonensis]
MGLAYLIIYGGFALLVALVGIAILVALAKGYAKTGLAILAVALAVGIWPAVPSYFDAQSRRAGVEALSFAPGTIDFAGKTVIFVESGSTICGDNVCGHALRHGGLARAFWTGSENLSYHHPDIAWPFDAIAQDPVIHEVEMTAPAEDANGFTYADPVAETRRLPDVDYTVLADESFIAFEYADAFGLAEKLPHTVRFAYMVFEGWPTAGQAPIARLLTVQFHQEPPFVWPVHTQFHYHPPLFENRDRVRAWFCDAPQDDAFFPPDPCAAGGN